MLDQDCSLTRRESLVLSATVATTAIAGCSEGNESGNEDTGNSEADTGDREPASEADGEPTGSAETDQTDSEDDSHRSEEESERADQTEQTEEDDAPDEEETDDETDDQPEEPVTVRETYVVPVNNGWGTYEEYTPRSTVTTIDGFTIQFDIPRIQSSIGIANEGVDLRLDGQSLSSEETEILQDGSETPVSITILMKGLVDPGEHTATIELDETIVDLPAGQQTVTKSVDFSVERPDATVLTDTFPVEEDVEVALETNIAPGQSIPTTMWNKEGERPAFFLPNEFEVESDGTASVAHNIAAIEETTGENPAGTEGIFSGRPATDDVTLFKKDIVLGE